MPLVPRTGRPATLVLLRAIKGSKRHFRLRFPVMLHRGEKHLRDGDDYGDEISGILREGRAFEGVLET